MHLLLIASLDGYPTRRGSATLPSTISSSRMSRGGRRRRKHSWFNGGTGWFARLSIHFPLTNSVCAPCLKTRLLSTRDPVISPCVPSTTHLIPQPSPVASPRAFSCDFLTQPSPTRLHRRDHASPARRRNLSSVKQYTLFLAFTLALVPCTVLLAMNIIGFFVIFCLDAIFEYYCFLLIYCSGFSEVLRIFLACDNVLKMSPKSHHKP